MPQLSLFIFFKTTLIKALFRLKYNEIEYFKNYLVLSLHLETTLLDKYRHSL